MTTTATTSARPPGRPRVSARGAGSPSSVSLRPADTPGTGEIIVHGARLRPGQRFVARNRISGRPVTLTYRGGGIHHSRSGPYLLATARNSNARVVPVDCITRVIGEPRSARRMVPS